MSRSQLWSFIVWAIAVGLPMTPWGKTTTGYIFLSIAAIAFLWLTYTWLRSVRIVDEVGPSQFASTPIEWILKLLILLFPVILLGAIAILLRQPTDERVTRVSGSSSDKISVGINCTPDSLPLRGKHGDSLYAIYLHPKWGNELVKFLYGSEGSSTYWPNMKTTGIAYQCEIVNHGNASLLGLTVLFRVNFRGENRAQRSRTIEIGLPDPIEAHKRFVFYAADDTGWTPKLLLPEEVSARINGESKGRIIQVQYSTLDGSPPELAGFGP